MRRYMDVAKNIERGAQKNVVRSFRLTYRRLAAAEIANMIMWASSAIAGTSSLEAAVWLAIMGILTTIGCVEMRQAAMLAAIENAQREAYRAGRLSGVFEEAAAIKKASADHELTAIEVGHTDQ